MLNAIFRHQLPLGSCTRIGSHLLGLEHDNGNKDAVMYPYYRGYQPGGLRLHSNDIRRIQALYGPSTGGGGVTNPPPRTPRPTNPPPSGKNI